MKKFIWFVVIVISGAALYFLGGRFNSTENKVDTVQKVVQATNSEIEKMMDEENFKKETILRARKVVNDKKKAEEESRHKEQMDKIEGEYEAIRQGELELVGTSVNLK